MRKPRIVIPDHPHHIAIRGNNRRRIFSYQSDYQRMLWDIGRALAAFEVTLTALVLMTNHAHLVLVPRFKQALSNFMKSFQQHYAHYRNRSRGGSGKLFEERYYCKPILTEPQLAMTLAYVDLNPVRAGLKDQPGDYLWSTYRLHAGLASTSKIDPAIWTPCGWYTEQAPHPADRAELYRQWVADCQRNDAKPDHAEELVEIEALSAKPYTLRLERPDRSRACEPGASDSLAKRR
jgi:REP element-mobilizing transposase RayT